MGEFLIRFFSPHHSNNHRAKLLESKAILAVIGFLIFSSFFFSSSLNPFSEKIIARAEVALNELVELTNEKRIENGLAPLKINEQLNDAANRKLNDMFENDYWSHNSPTGTTPWFFIKESGYNYVYAGENLARGFTDSKDVIDAWMASPDHRENVLSPNYQDVGFAIKSGTLGGEETILIVEEFGSKDVLNATSVSRDLEKSSDGSMSSAISFDTSAMFIISLIAIFIVVFIIDIFTLRKKNIFRFVGHNLDHVIFLGGIIFVVLFISRGVIL